jgi:hypothetical protein
MEYFLLLSREVQAGELWAELTEAHRSFKGTRTTSAGIVVLWLEAAAMPARKT